ncbi:type VI secretion system Vgr family protein [Massilia sp. TS11]|uniref:type VI secretion system Vgr family protein n=1 Tax=Massilia sp. TS11 TaxID=2908003 RepID=UPI001EDBEA68|nr:type VI secretion system Vgr family protein [Massilia sp. TS11]MCG2586108.1 type VI secretion system tip protein VgrG [Massilia sp. TS11]
MNGSQVLAEVASSVFGSDSQHHRLLRLDFPRSDGPDQILLPNMLNAHEEVSRGFRIEVEALSDDARIPLKAMMGKMVTISLVREDGSLRYFNGYVTEFRFLRADGGFAFYHFVLEPWLAFARLHKDCISFHNRNVREITELSFAKYRQADWRLLIYGEDPKLTCANQYNETDWNHLHRRWEDLGLYYWYEHRADGHTLILSDNSHLAEPIDATRFDGPDVIQFQNLAGSEEGDGIREWNAVRRLGSAKTSLASFNYKSPTPQQAGIESLNEQGDVFQYEIYEDTGSYGFKDRDDGERIAKQRMEELDKDRQFFEGESNHRTLAPGRTFKLGGHFSGEPRPYRRDEAARSSIANRDYLVLSVDHVASNNYPAGLGAVSSYENSFTCVRKDIRWRPGRNFNTERCPDPGIQTATVVGPDGAEIHTDELGRVRVQFHWDRLGNSDQNSSPWLRVMTPGAGNEFGHIRLPRVGEEVAVVFLDGNIDHPVILGSFYNARHAPPWNLDEQMALSGIRSRELGGSERGNQLIFDDTRASIQTLLRSDHLSSQLALGNIGRIEGTEGRKETRGEGWELRSDGHGIARAARGILITTETRQDARGPIKDMGETSGRLAAAAELHQVLADAAKKNGAQDASGDQAETLAAIQAQNAAIEGLNSNRGNFPEIAKPHLVLSSPAGIATTTANSTHIASDLDTSLTSGKSVSIAAGHGFFASVRQAFRLFVQRAGMKLIAAAGDIDVSALTDSIHLLAKLNITQTANRVFISAKDEIVINGGGSYARFGSGGIEVGTKGNFFFHAASHEFNGAKSMPVPDLKNSAEDLVMSGDLHLEYVDADDAPLQHDPIEAHAWDGQKHSGTLDGAGQMVIKNVARGSFRADQKRRK